MKFQMEVMISDLIFVNKDYQHTIVDLSSSGEKLKEQLREILPKAMAEVDDPDTRGKSPNKYIENLYTNKLGDFTNRIILTCNQKGTIKGIIIALPEKNSPKTYHVFTIGVNKECRGKSIGEDLLKSLAERLIKKGIERVIIDVHEQNVSAIKFYSRLGFKTC